VSVPKEKILVADDEPDVLALCLRVIRSEGYEATGARNGMDAIRVAEQEHFDLFLTDIMMPGLKGLETAQRIREFQPHIVCVVMTGFGTMDTAIQALELGFTEFVVKPFKPQDLKVAVNRALEKERLRSENERLRTLVPLFELNKTLMATVEEDVLARKVLHTAVAELQVDAGMLLLCDKKGTAHVGASFGESVAQLSDGQAGTIIDAVTTLLDTPDQLLLSASQEASAPAQAIMQALKAQTVLLNPLMAMDTLVGAVIVSRTDPRIPFSPVDRELLSVLCGQAAVALENARLFEEIQRAYRELQELDHMKSEFINIAAHELRTPLAILMGHADLLQEDTEDLRTKNRLQIMVRNALRLRDLINDLLDMRQLQTAEARVHLSTFEIEELIDVALQDFWPLADKKEIQISSNIPPDLVAVSTDRQKVLITLHNLLLNAIKFTPSKGRVGVEVAAHDHELWVSVWDTGIGIPEDQCDKIFLPFYQASDSLTREHEGMGLGLSIAKGMIELCGGRIWVASVLGQGSRFTFSIPTSEGANVLPVSADNRS
jgi:signal transduction histidine kinase/CheY-like chemotaxis protein